MGPVGVSYLLIPDCNQPTGLPRGAIQVILLGPIRVSFLLVPDCNQPIGIPGLHQPTVLCYQTALPSPTWVYPRNNQATFLLVGRSPYLILGVTKSRHLVVWSPILANFLNLARPYLY